MRSRSSGRRPASRAGRAAAVTSPSSSCVLDGRDRLHLAHGRGQERLAAPSSVLAGARAPRPPPASITRARVIEARMCSDSGGVRSTPSRDPEERRRRALQHAAVRGDQQRLVEAALPGQPRAQHVGGVGERLDAVQHPRGRVGDGAQSQPRSAAGAAARISSQAPPAAREHQAQAAVNGTGLRSRASTSARSGGRSASRRRLAAEPAIRSSARRAQTGARRTGAAPRTRRRRAAAPRRWPGWWPARRGPRDHRCRPGAYGP